MNHQSIFYIYWSINWIRSYTALPCIHFYFMNQINWNFWANNKENDLTLHLKFSWHCYLLIKIWWSWWMLNYNSGNEQNLQNSRKSDLPSRGFHLTPLIPIIFELFCGFDNTTRPTRQNNIIPLEVKTLKRYREKEKDTGMWSR